MNKKIDLGFLSLGGREWNQSYCQCDLGDPDVAISPCHYCAEFCALKEADRLQSTLDAANKEIERLKEVLSELLDILDVNGDERYCPTQGQWNEQIRQARAALDTDSNHVGEVNEKVQRRAKEVTNDQFLKQFLSNSMPRRVGRASTPINKVLSPLRSIRWFCTECMGGSKYEVELCGDEECWLYPYRMGIDPRRKKREYTDEQKESMRKALDAARECKNR